MADEDKGGDKGQGDKGHEEPRIPKWRLDEEAGKRAEVQKQLDAATARLAEFEKQVKGFATVAAERDAARAEITAVRAAAAFEIAAHRAGLTDPEDVAEFRDRYDRVQPGEDGKKPTPGDYFAKIKEAPPKWARAYFDPPAKDEDEADDPPPRRTADPAKDEGKAGKGENGKRADPNGGVNGNGAGKSRRFDDAAVARMSDADFRSNLGGVAKGLLDEGKVVMSETTRKRLGLA